jgi:2-phosphosulfolactate phosphatase
MNLDTILTPAELPALARRDLRRTACVVFDVLRATSTFVTALHHGAREIIPVNEIPEALALRQKHPDVLLAGERAGVKIRAAQPGGIDFDLGNSPREFIPEKIRGRTIVSTTTNGTRALRACAGAQTILAASFLNLSATADFLRQIELAEILLVCAGTGENIAWEDVLAAGALADKLAGRKGVSSVLSDSTEIARRTFGQAQSDWAAVFSQSQNARRLLAIPELREDVRFCGQTDIFNVVAEMQANGALQSGSTR